MSDTTQPNGQHDHLESSRAHARAAAEEMRGAAADVARELRDRVEEFTGDWQGKARDIHKNLETYVRENPTKSVLAALGAGFVIGLILRR